MVEQLVAMLQSRSGCACRTAAATLADLAMVSRESCEALIQVCGCQHHLAVYRRVHILETVCLHGDYIFNLSLRRKC